MKHLFILLLFLPIVCLAQTPSVTITSVTLASQCAGASGAKVTVTFTSTGDFVSYAYLYLNGPGIPANTQIANQGETGLNGTVTGTIPAYANGQYTIKVTRALSTTVIRGINKVIESPPSNEFTVYTPPKPTVLLNYFTYCQNDVATVSLASSVTGTGSIKWYTTEGDLLSEAPTLSTSAVNTFVYGITQIVDGCESTRSAIIYTVSDCNLRNGFQVGLGSGTKNTFLGAFAGRNTTIGSNNVFLGFQAGNKNTTSTSNVFIGNSAGYNNSTAAANVFIGDSAGYSNITGTGNLYLGQQAGANATTASYNLFMGSGAGSSTTTGGDNTAIGDKAGSHNSIGQRNTAIGKYAGLNSQTGNDNVFIGYGTKAGTTNPTNLTNAAAIGANAIVNQSNSIVLGSGANVGIGTSTPSAKMHITTGTANTSGLRLENLTNTSPASIGNQAKFLTVDGNGNVILGSIGALRVAADSWSVLGDQLQNTNQGSVIIGQNLKAPAGYKLIVEQGILTEKVKVAVRNTSEWSDYVFDDTYSLKGLSEVERYIKANKHLPDIPSAKEMVRQGNDLHQTDVKLLEKIEELTLYSIDLEKKVEAEKYVRQQQQAEIDQLKRLVNQMLKKK